MDRIKKTKRTKDWQFKNYRDGLSVITMVALHYDGYNPNSAKQMRELVDELADIAAKTLLDNPVFLNHKKESLYMADGGYRKK